MRFLISFRIRILLMVLVIGNSTSCVDEIPLEGPEGEGRKMVIQGVVQAGNPNIIDVSLGRSANFQGFSEAVPVENALVSVQDEEGRQLALRELKPGNYQLIHSNSSLLSFDAGKRYKLIVQTANSLYTSSFEELLEVPKIDSITTEIEIRNELNEVESIIPQKYIKAKVFTSAFPEGSDKRAYFKWDFEGVYSFLESPPSEENPFIEQKTCYVTENPSIDKVAIFNGFESSKDRIDNLVIWEEPTTEKFFYLYYLIVYQQSLSRGAFEYWDKINQLVDRNAGLFEPPPGKVFSNISNTADPEEEVLGYFYITQTDTIRKLIRGVEIDNLIDRCSVGKFPTRSVAPDYCNDCLTWPNSTLTKPEWWEN